MRASGAILPDMSDVLTAAAAEIPRAVAMRGLIGCMLSSRIGPSADES
jgi:hypothetical protein